MSEERVDKQWKAKGIAAYSTQAILGTLGHYGVSVDEAGLRASAAAQTPMELAQDWRAKWKGKGQFEEFPYAAANELMERLFPERPTPRKLAAALAEATVTGDKALGGAVDAVGPALDKANALVAGLPTESERRDAFVAEVGALIDPWARAFGDLPKLLAKAGRRPEAERFAALHEALFPERQGCAMAVVRGECGEREAAVADLQGWAGDATRDLFARYHAFDGLSQLEGWAAMQAVGLGVFDAAAEQDKWGVADSVAHLLGHAIDEAEVDVAFAREVERRLELAHQKTGGHHHH